MEATYFRGLFDYNRWANARMLSTVARLSEADFLKDLGSSFKSVRDTAVHILGGEWIWLERWKGDSPKALLPAAEFLSLAPLRSRWAEVEADQVRFLAGLTDEALRRDVPYKNLKGESHAYPLGHLMAHVVNHSTYHRGQITTLLRQLGADAVSTDYVAFLAQRK